MKPALPKIYLARHGETAWTITGQHTGLTDLPLTERGEANSRRLGKLIGGEKFGRVFCSPLQRARRTCELAGFAAQAEIEAELVEWNYGDYEGQTTAEIRTTRAGWSIFDDGCPGGESVGDVSARADRVIVRLRDLNQDVLLFSSGHFLRMLAARWLGLPPSGGKLLLLTTATLSVLGYDHGLDEPVIRLWNDDRHVGD
jgi:broad specificity phosphatase PhoE